MVRKYHKNLQLGDTIKLKIHKDQILCEAPATFKINEVKIFLFHLTTSPTALTSVAISIVFGQIPSKYTLLGKASTSLPKR